MAIGIASSIGAGLGMGSVASVTKTNKQTQVDASRIFKNYFVLQVLSQKRAQVMSVVWFTEFSMYPVIVQII